VPTSVSFNLGLMVSCASCTITLACSCHLYIPILCMHPITQPGCPRRPKHHLHKSETTNYKAVTVWWILHLVWTEDLLPFDI